MEIFYRASAFKKYLKQKVVLAFINDYERNIASEFLEKDWKGRPEKISVEDVVNWTKIFTLALEKCTVSEEELKKMSISGCYRANYKFIPIMSSEAPH